MSTIELVIEAEPGMEPQFRDVQYLTGYQVKVDIVRRDGRITHSQIVGLLTDVRWQP